jgi:hypothetical protein
VWWMKFTKIEWNIFSSPPHEENKLKLTNHTYEKHTRLKKNLSWQLNDGEEYTSVDENLSYLSHYRVVEKWKPVYTKNQRFIRSRTYISLHITCMKSLYTLSHNSNFSNLRYDCIILCCFIYMCLMPKTSPSQPEKIYQNGFPTALNLCTLSFD